jgi:lipopolysaccharide export system permease protein
MLFHSSLRRELSRSFGATWVVLVTVVMTMTLIRTLGQASRGSFNPSDVTLVMGYTVLAYMPTLLSLSLFMSIIATLTRMYRDSEMVIWFCSGKGLSSLLSPLMHFSWPIFAVIALLALLVLPWTNQRIDELKNQYERRGDLERVEPGQFQESANGNRVFFVEKNVTEAGKESITSARKGRVDSLPQGRFLLLENGQRLESVRDTQNLKVSEFVEYGTQVSSERLPGEDFRMMNTRSTKTLLADPSLAARGELSWRIGLIIAAINFVIIGIAISSVNPRIGKSVNLVFALFTFVIYFNLVNLGQSWIAGGKLSSASYMLALHGGVFTLAVLWLSKGHNNWHWNWLLPKPSATDHRTQIEP